MQNYKFFLLVACNPTDLFNNNWRQAEGCMMLFVGAVEMNVLAQGALRLVAQWQWIEHQNPVPDLPIGLSLEPQDPRGLLKKRYA